MLGHGVGTVRMKGRFFVLRNLFHLSVQLGCRSLIYAAFLGKSELPDGFQDAQHANCVHVGRKFGGIETYLDMALRSKVVDFVRTHSSDHSEYAHRISEVGIVKMEVRLAFEVGNSLTEVHG